MRRLADDEKQPIPDPPTGGGGEPGPSGRRGWWALLALPFLLLAAILIAGATDAGQRWLAAAIVEQVNGRIPGRIGLERAAIGLDGIHLAGVTVQVPGEDAPAVEAAEVHVAPALALGLLQGRVRVHDARLVDARVRLVSPADGGPSNLARAFASPDASPGDASAGAWEVIIDHLSIERAGLFVGTEGEAPQLDLDALSLTLRGRADEEGATLQGVATAAFAAPVRGAVSLDFDATAAGGYRRLDVRRLVGGIGASTFALRGAADLEKLGGRLDELAVRLEPADVPGLVEGWSPTVPLRLSGGARFADGTLSAELELVQEALAAGSAAPSARGGSDGRLRIDAQLQPVAGTWRVALEGEGIDPHGFDARAPRGAVDLRTALTGAGLDEAEGSIELPRLQIGAASAGPIRLEGAWKDDQLELKALRVQLAGGSLEARGLAGLERGDVRFDLKAANLRQLAASAERLATAAGVVLPSLPAVQGDARIRGSIAGPWNAPTIDGTLRAGALGVGDVQATEVDGDLDLAFAGGPTGRVSLRLERLDASSARFDALTADLHLGGKQVRGSVDASTAAGRVRADIDMAPSADWQALHFTRLDLRWPRANWSLRQPLLVELVDGVAVRGLALQSASGGRIDADGRLASRGALQLTLDGSSIDLAELPAQLAPAELGLVGKLTMVARLEGTLARPKGTVELRVEDGGLLDVEGIAIRADGRVDGRALDATLEIQRGAARLGAKGHAAWPIAERGEMQLDASLRSLDLAEVARLLALDMPFAGLAEADVALRGSLADPRGTIDLRGSGLSAAGVTNARAEVHAALGDDVSLRAAGTLHASTVQGELVFATSPARFAADPAAVAAAPMRGSIDAKGVQLGRFFVAAEGALPVRGTVDFHADLGGTLQAPRGTARLALADGWNGEIGPLDAELTLHAEAQATRLEITSRLLGKPFLAGGLGIDTALEQLTVPGALRRSALHGELAARGLELGAVAWAGGYRGRTSGTLDGNLVLGGTAGAPSFELRGGVADFALGGTEWGDVRIDATYASRALAASLGLDGAAGGTARLQGTWPIDLGLPAVRDGSLAAIADLPLDLAFEARALDLGFARGLSRDLHQAEGKLDGAVRIRGALPLPTFEGALALQEGRFGYTGHGDIRDVAIELELQPEAIHLRRLEATSSGTITASGSARRRALDQPYDIDLRLESKRFALVTGDLVRGWLDADAVVTGKAGVEGVDAHLAIRRSRIELADTPPKDVQSLEPHPDFIISRNGVAPTVRIEKKKVGGSTNYPLVLAIVSEEPIRIEGTDVELQAKTDLKMLLGGGVPQLVGVVQVESGHVLVMSRRFEFSRGRVYYTGAEEPGDPRLDVVVRYESPIALVTVTVGGTAQRPTTNLRSNPPYSEGEIAELLATGRLQGRAGAAGGGATGAASALGAVLTSQLKKGIAAKLPLDVISFQAGEEDPFAGSRLEAGSYLTDRIYVGYARRFEADAAGTSERDRKNKNEVRMEYQLAPRWTLEATYGDANVGGADLVWTRDF